MDSEKTEFGLGLMTTDFIIIGGGPSGCAAALFASKVKRNAILLHKGTTSFIHTFQWLLPGFSQGPAEWLKSLRGQIEQAGVQFVEEEVVEAALGTTVKQITTSSGKLLEAQCVILATGCYDRQGYIEGESKFAGHGVFYNAYQDGALCENEVVVVEGKNENAIREVLYLTRFANKVYFIVPAMKLEGDEKLLEGLRSNSKVEVWLSASIKTVEGDQHLESVVVLSAGEEKRVEAKAVFLYARPSRPKYEFLKGTVEISEDGCVLVDENFMTSIPGVFACGGMLSGVPQLPFVSTAQGMIAAMNADRYLSNLSL